MSEWFLCVSDSPQPTCLYLNTCHKYLFGFYYSLFRDYQHKKDNLWVKGLPKIPSVSVISLERELSKIVMLIVTVYYRKRIQMKISNVKRHIEQGSGETSSKILFVLSVWNHLDSTQFSQQDVWQKTRNSASQTLSCALVSKGLLFFSSVRSHGTPMWPTLLFSLQPLRRSDWYTMVKGPHW